MVLSRAYGPHRVYKPSTVMTLCIVSSNQVGIKTLVYALQTLPVLLKLIWFPAIYNV